MRTNNKVVLEACEDLKIEVVMRPPRWSERESEFKEAFLTSTSRLVRKKKRMNCVVEQTN